MRLRRCVLLLVFPFILFSSGCRRAAVVESELNLGFESRLTNNTPSNWYVGGRGYEASLDSAVMHGGKYGLHLRYDHDEGAPGESFGVGTSTFPIQEAKGKKIRLSGWIRTHDVSEMAGLWLRVDGPDGVLAFNNMTDTGIKGTHEWTHYSFELPVAENATNINFGVLLVGHGEAWFDDLSIQLDGKEYVEPLPFEPSADQIAWLKKHSTPIKTVDAGHGFDDLSEFHSFIGSAKIVGLGEATHGTSEFFRMKHRMLEYLVEKEGFNMFAIEANMPESYRINEYVLTGKGDPATLLNGIYFWTWNTQEVLDMIKWMREYNASGKGKLQFVGFDMQTAKVAEAGAEELVSRADPKFLDSVRAAYQTVNLTVGMSWSSDTASMSALVNAAIQSATDVLRHLEQNQARYEQKLSRDTVSWMIQNARIVQQAIALQGNDTRGSFRDSCMAFNLAWIDEHNPGARIAVWAHNAHVMKTAGHMGSWLSQRYEAGYTIIGFAFNEGTYTAVPESRGHGAATMTAAPAKIGSLEYVLHKVDLPSFFLNLHDAKASDPNSAWLTKPIPVRDIGAVESAVFFPEVVSDEYDGLIFIDHSTHSKLLPKN